MPYISQELRADAELAPELPGELNFAITKVIDRWLDLMGVSYSNLNTAIGALECAKLELYRRIAAPYEDAKLAENGDVYLCKS